MPLHLLGKKSWNVYNADNVARVKRDEAEAKAREEAEEQRLQEIDAERRLAILRGEVPPPLPPSEPQNDDPTRSRTRARDDDHRRREPRKRKRFGEDDTDFEMRVARERADAAYDARQALAQPKQKPDAPLLDSRGHIDLFPEDRIVRHSQKNEEAEREAEKKKREYEDQYTMRFSNAAGKEGIDKAWYSATGDSKELADREMPGKDVWGNEDPRRKDREAARIVSNDPLAMMKRGAAKVREVTKERKRFQDEREKELKQLRKDERREERRREKRRRREDRADDVGEARSRDKELERRHRRTSDQDRESDEKHSRRHSYAEGDRHRRSHPGHDRSSHRSQRERSSREGL